MAKPTPTPTSANLAQQRSAQAARGFLNRPQAGQQGAPQNRAERRQAARLAKRAPKTASFDTAADRAAAETPVKARDLVAAAPAALGHTAAKAALQMHRGFASGAIFPVRDLIPALLFTMFVALLFMVWAAPFGLKANGHFAAQSAAIGTGFAWAWFAAGAMLSWRSVLPSVAALGVSATVAVAAPGPMYMTSLLAAFGLLFVWLIGPQVGNVFSRTTKH